MRDLGASELLEDSRRVTNRRLKADGNTQSVRRIAATNGSATMKRPNSVGETWRRVRKYTSGVANLVSWYCRRR